MNKQTSNTKTAKSNKAPSVAKLPVATARALNSEGNALEKLASNIYYGIVSPEIVAAFDKDMARNDGEYSELKDLMPNFTRRYKNQLTQLINALTAGCDKVREAVDKRREAKPTSRALSLSYIDGALNPKKVKPSKGANSKEKATPFENAVQQAKNLQAAITKGKFNADEMAIILGHLKFIK